jgi:glycosyltransferase involved in cell wall biosynthesis
MSAPQHETSSLSGKTVCLVSSGHVGSNPRLVKEADALAQAGVRVEVVAVNVTRLPEVQARDSYILDRGLWPCTRIGASGFIARALQAAIQRVSMLAFAVGIKSDWVARKAYAPLIARLSRAAAAIPADLYIAHNLAALPAAQRAASRNKARLGFDAEDFHSGQFADTAANAPSLRLTRHIERLYLPRCDYLTAASPGIGRAYAGACGVDTPITVLNVFSKGDAPERPSQRGSAPHAPSLYWFSQTIGPDRGLEDALVAIAASRSRPWLYLQGRVVPGYERRLNALAATLGVADRLIFVAPSLPDDLPKLASQYDAGLALEPADTANRNACLSNKIFTYLLAGLPVLATDTAGQGELAAEIPGAMRMLPLADPTRWPAIIDALLEPQTLPAARKAAWTAAQGRFNWEREQRAFLQTVTRALRPSIGD